MGQVSSVNPTTQITVPTRTLTETATLPQVIIQFFKEKAKDLAKAIGYTAGWAVELIPNLPSSVQGLGYLMGDVKNFLSATEIPDKANKLVHAVQHLFSNSNPLKGEPTDPTHLIIHRVTKVFKEGASLVNSVCDGTVLTSKFVPIPAEAMRAVKGTAYGATLIGAGIGAQEQIKNICDLESKQTEKKAEKRTLYMINLARDVSYVALAVFGLGSLIMGIAAAPVIMLAFLTSGLLFTIGGFFYEKMVDPESTGMNVPPRVLDTVKKIIAQNRPAVAA